MIAAATIRNAGHETESTQFVDVTSKTDAKLYRGVGATIEPGAGIDRMLAQADLDWKVTEQELRHGKPGRLKRISSHKALTRSDNGEMLDIVGAGWKPFQNRDIVKTFKQFCGEVDTHIERLGSLDGGRCIFAIASLSDEFKLADNDVVNGKLLLTNYHKGGYGQRVSLMTIRQVCTNGLTMPVRIGNKVISHTGEYSHDKAMAVLQAARNGFKQFEQDAIALSTTELDDSVARQFLISQFGKVGAEWEEQPKRVQQLYRMYQGDAVGADKLSAYRTAWGMLNAVTEHFNHHAATPWGESAHLSSLWQGGKAQQQIKTMRQAVRLCV